MLDPLSDRRFVGGNEKAVTSAQTELVSRSRVVGQLVEAKKRHPKVADFEAFLKRVDGLKRSRL